MYYYIIMLLFCGCLNTNTARICCGCGRDEDLENAVKEFQKALFPETNSLVNLENKDQKKIYKKEKIGTSKKI